MQTFLFKLESEDKLGAIFNFNSRIKIALNSAFGICQLELLHCCQLALP